MTIDRKIKSNNERLANTAGRVEEISNLNEQLTCSLNVCLRYSIVK
jgi:hypothetical protein